MITRSNSDRQTWNHLWSGNGSETTGKLSEDYDNFQMLLVVYKTNSDYFVRIVYAGIGNFGATETGGAWDTSRNCFLYESSAFITFSSKTEFSISKSSSNVNWVLKPVHIYGYIRKF